MKRLLMFSFIFYCSNAIAQVNNDLIIEQIERMTENSEDENVDYSELLETYWNITENPININSDEIDILAEFRFIDVFQLEKIKEYRHDYGNFQIIEELYEVDGLDGKSIEMIKPLICFKDKKDEKIKIHDILKYGKNKIMMETSQCLNKKKGYQDVEDSILYEKPNSAYLGSPQKIYLRYNYTYHNKIEAGIVLEKDPGEYLLKSNLNDSIIKLLGNKAYSGFDFYSFHIYIQNHGFLKTLAIGDYKVSFGQGLTMGSGMAFDAKGGNLLRRSKKISASKSANESYYLRGLASCFEYRNLELSVFYSRKKSDANIISYDDDNITPLEISSLQQNGLHRTHNEIMDRKAVSQQLYGLNFSYMTSRVQFGYTVHKTNLSAQLSPDSTIYNIFYFRGKSIINHGFDFYFILDKMLFYGETAMSNNGGFAGLLGTCIQPTGYVELNILYRKYARNYQCLYSNAFSAGSNTRNEEGIYFSTAFTLAANWKYITSIDFYKSDWIKSTSHAPCHAYDFDSQLNYQPNNNMLLFLEYRNKNKMKNTRNYNTYQRYLTNEKSNMVRFHISYNISEHLTLKNRIEYHINNDEEGIYNSYLIYQDINYNHAERQYSIAFRYELFNTEKGSVYAHENDILNAFSVGALSGKGIRTYLVGKVNIFKQVKISAKLGATFYDDRNEIGSGLERIENNIKADAKVQLIWSF